MKSVVENMNIALVHDCLTSVEGSERVLLALKEIYPDAPIYTSVFDKNRASEFSKFDVRPSVLQSMKFLHKYRELLIPLTPFAFENINLSDFDLVISNTSFAAKGVILKPETVHICYCHTPTRYLWSPEIDPRGSGKMRSKIQKKLKRWDLVASARPDFYIGNSNNISAKIKKFYGRNAITIYPPVDVELFKPGEEKDVKDYFLFVSRLVKHKKCDLVIEAFNKLNLPLKIIGRGPEKKRLERMANKNVEFLNFLPDQELKKYYAEARAFIFAAEEDFGIVPVEAMASGRPVIAFGAGGAKETVVDGETGVFFYPQTAEALEQAVGKFSQMKFDSNKIRKQAEKFSKERFKKEFESKVRGMVEEYKRNF